jgi:alginate O-acetyltransferase complex protein AlgI
VVFSQLVFLFLFLPIVLLVYTCLRSVPLRNAFLLFASLFFYAWGELNFLWVMVLSIVLNYAFAIVIDDAKGEGPRKLSLLMAVFVNLGILVFFKYFDFILTEVDIVLAKLHLQQIPIAPISLPLGISFFTFHSLSYVIDIYRKQAKAQRNPINLALYISLFPQLVAGPIIRYHDVCGQITERKVTLDKFAEGTRRFVIGLGKKMLIANTVGAVADKVFGMNLHELTPGVAWLGTICYTLQIYFDFSGYSDMAIGLGLMFGFRFLENFNFPYISQSIREFWQRWHISLSNWFRDYLYIPLGGNRMGEWRTRFNLVTVFFLCGLWHGASWNFIIWGLYHGAFLGLERSKFGEVLQKIPRPLKHVYTMFVVMMGWVLFRAETLRQTMMFYKAMFGLAHPIASEYTLGVLLDNRVLFILLLGILGSTPIIRDWIFPPTRDVKTQVPLPEVRQPAYRAVIRTAWIGAILSLSITEMAAGTYNPFIYFRF